MNKIVVNYDSDNGWTNIIDKIHSFVPQITEEFKSAKNVIVELTDNTKPSNWLKWADSMGYIDKELLNFLSDVDSGKRQISDIDDYMNQASSSTSKFAATLKTVAANIAIMTVINIAIKAVTTAWDNFNETVEESRAKVDEITGKLENLNTELSELKNEQNKTQYDHMRIQQIRLPYKLHQ